jgi:hypothetical protein
MKKKKYDKSMAMLYHIGREELLPKAFRKQIPNCIKAAKGRISQNKMLHCTACVNNALVLLNNFKPM